MVGYVVFQLLLLRSKISQEAMIGKVLVSGATAFGALLDSSEKPTAVKRLVTVDFEP